MTKRHKISSQEGDALLDAFVRRPVKEGQYEYRRPALSRILVTTSVIIGIWWLWSDMFDELLYQLKSQELQVVEAVHIPFELDQRYVQLEGVLGQKAATLSGRRPGSLRFGPIQFRQIIGTSVLVEFDQNKYLETYTGFSRHHFRGRLHRVADRAEYAAIFKYFHTRFAWTGDDFTHVLIVDEEPKLQYRYILTFLFSLFVSVFSVLNLIRSARRFKPYAEQEGEFSC